MVTHDGLMTPPAPVVAPRGDRIPGPPDTRRADVAGRAVVYGLAVVGLLTLVVPTVITLVAAFDTRDFIGFPPESLGLDRFVALAQNRAIIDAAVTSVAVGVAAVVIDVVLGTPAAIALVRREFRGKALLLGFLQMPLMLPGIVIGISLLIFFSAAGLDLSYEILVAGHVVLTFPFVLRVTMARMERADVSVEEAARNLGASSWTVFTRIQLPFLRPGLIAGAAFAFLVSFDNLTISLFVTPVGDMTLPVQLFFLMRFNLDPVVAAVAAVQVLLTLVVIVAGLRLAGEDAIVRE